MEGYDDVPRTQPQPVGPESLIESKEAFVLPRLHHSIQRPFVDGASGQNPLVHHSCPDHVDGVGGQRPRQAAGETGAAGGNTVSERKTGNVTLKGGAKIKRLT